MSTKFWLWTNTCCLILWTVTLINHLNGIPVTSTAITCAFIMCITHFVERIARYFAEERNNNGTENGPSGSADL